MAKRPLPNADEDGNLLPELDPTSPMAQIVFFIEYCRKRGFQAGPQIQVGDTIVQVRDLRQSPGAEQVNRQPDLVPGSDMAILLGDKGNE